MKREPGLFFGAVLIISLYVVTGKSVSARGQGYNYVDERSHISISEASATDIPCSDTFHEQEIPDDGS